MSAHTSGDWYKRSKGAVTVCTDSNEDTHIIATINEFAPGDTDANARLMCAAPNLLAVLKEILHTEAIESDNLYNAAVDAIYKATGERL